MKKEVSYDAMMDGVAENNFKSVGLSKEELLKPRYKVIADYPESKLPINSVIEHWMDSGYLSYIPYLCISHPEKYPAIFKKLEWWEERQVEDMPEYVKFGQDAFIWKIDKWTKNMIDELSPHSKDEEGNDFLMIEWHFNRKLSIPATKEEYEKQGK